MLTKPVRFDLTSDIDYPKPIVPEQEKSAQKNEKENTKMSRPKSIMKSRTEKISPSLSEKENKSKGNFINI